MVNAFNKLSREQTIFMINYLVNENKSIWNVWKRDSPGYNKKFEPAGKYEPFLLFPTTLYYNDFNEKFNKPREIFFDNFRKL